MIGDKIKNKIPLDSIYIAGKRESLEIEQYRSSQNNSILITSRPLS